MAGNRSVSCQHRSSKPRNDSSQGFKVLRRKAIKDRKLEAESSVECC